MVLSRKQPVRVHRRTQSKYERLEGLPSADFRKSARLGFVGRSTSLLSIVRNHPIELVGTDNGRTSFQPEQQINMYIVDFDKFHDRQFIKPTVSLNRKLAPAGDPLKWL